MNSLKLHIALTCLISISACTTVSGPATEEKAQDASRFNAELGTEYLQRGELELARSKLEKALEQDRRNALAHVSYARLMQRIDDTANAKRHFDQAIALEPDSAEHRNSYGIFLCEQGDTANAVEQFLLAAKNPYYQTPEFALDNAGLCLLDSNDLAGAEKYLRDALRANPRFPGALLHMANLTFQQRRLTVADAYLLRFREYSAETPQSLLLALNIKRDAGDLTAAKYYADRLLGDFASSREAGEYLARPLQ